MPVLHNAAGDAVPVRERRENSGILNALNSEVVLDLNGDESALVYVGSTAFAGTLEFSGRGDGEAGFLPVVAFPFSPGCAGGTIPQAGQPLILDALVAANTVRVYSVPCGQLRALRVRASVYTSGAAAVTITSDANEPLNKAIAAKPSTSARIADASRYLSPMVTRMLPLKPMAARASAATRAAWPVPSCGSW
jgi:hypothetical protein